MTNGLILQYLPCSDFHFQNEYEYDPTFVAHFDLKKFDNFLHSFDLKKNYLYNDYRLRVVI